MSESLPAAAPLLQIDRLKVHFPISTGTILRRTTGQVQAVDDLTLALSAGETVGLVGESGSGKTTLGRAIVGLYRPTAGSIRFRGTELGGLRGRDERLARAQMQMVFQDPYASLDPRWRVRASVAEPLRIPHRRSPGAARARGLAPEWSGCRPGWPTAIRTSCRAGSASVSASPGRSR